MHAESSLPPPWSTPGWLPQPWLTLFADVQCMTKPEYMYNLITRTCSHDIIYLSPNHHYYGTVVHIFFPPPSALLNQAFFPKRGSLQYSASRVVSPQPIYYDAN